MKKISLIILIGILSINVFGQTNKIESTGNVGIGTLSPYGNLELKGLTQRMIFSTTTSNQENAARIEFWENLNNITNYQNAHFSLQYDGLNDAFRFRGYQNVNSMNVDLFTILRSGNIGIGTISPSEELEIHVGDVFGETLISSERNGDNEGIGRIGFEGRTSNSTELKYAGVQGSITSSSASNPIGALHFETRDGSGSYLKRMTINGSNVGIGTSSPTGNFELQGESQRFIFSTVTSNQENAARIEFWENLTGIDNRDNAHFSIQYDGLNDALRFKGKNGTVLNDDLMIIKRNGQIGIGTGLDDLGNHKFAVQGSIGAREIKVEASGWSDFVFYDGYELRTLEEVEQHIEENGHLPEIPSKAEVTENGINLGEMNAKLLQKIEELTLYLIEQNKQLKNANQNIVELQKEVSALKKQ